ncbi:MAG: 2-C-methyl-D-erythritol 4-phosphate cytidylyltransferase [Chthoniobacterales bacterium]
MAKPRTTKGKDGVWAVIVAGGSSRRMGFNKLTADLEGRPVLAWTVAAFAECTAIDSIVLVCAASAQAELEKIAREAAPKKLHAIVAGGAHRHLSVAEGLAAVPASAAMIVVHDAARPLVTCEMIKHCLESARNNGAAACARPVTDTLKRINDEGFIIESVDRSHLWAVETPQTFRADLLRRAYAEVIATGGHVSDETSAVQAAGAPVALVDAGGWNGKITFPADLELARTIIRGRAGS